MKACLTAGLVLLIIAAVVGSYIRSQHARLQAADASIAEQGETISALGKTNAAQAAAIAELRHAKNRDEALVADTAETIDQLTTRIQRMDRTTREALRNAPNLGLDSLLPAAAANALCLQWHEASGKMPPASPVAADHSGKPAGGAHARAGHTAPPKRGAAPDCSGWRKMTVRDAVEWNGLLLRHAGLEREDKAALRRWAGEK